MTSGQVAPAGPGLRHDANDVVQFVFDDGSGREEADGYNPEMCHQYARFVAGAVGMTS